MATIDPQLDEALSAFICGWHAFEQQNGVDIIDMALSEKINSKTYASRQDVLKDIETFLAMDDVKAHPLVYKKMNAHHFFLRMSMGEDIPFDTYFENVMGTKPVLFSDAKIEAIRQNAQEALSLIGLTLHPGIEENLDPNKKEIFKDVVATTMDEMHRQFYGEINKKLNLKTDFILHYSELPENTAFGAWISGDGKDYSVQLNLGHIAKMPSFYIKMLGVHELSAHAVQFSCMRDLIEKASLPRYMGYVTVNEPVQLAVEGLATSLHHCYPDEFGKGPYEDALSHLQRLSYATFNNAGIHFSRGAKYEDCLDYVVQKGCTPEKRCALRLNFVRDHKPVGYGYRQIYGLALEAFREIADHSSKKDAFIRSVYTSYLTPDDIMRHTTQPLCDFV